jgi:hypothetical protein
LAYQPPANSTFLSEQTSHHQPVSSTFLSEQTSTSHQLGDATGGQFVFAWPEHASTPHGAHRDREGENQRTQLVGEIKSSACRRHSERGGVAASPSREMRWLSADGGVKQKVLPVLFLCGSAIAKNKFRYYRPGKTTTSPNKFQ